MLAVEPVLDFQALDVLEVLHVAGDERDPLHQCRRCNQRIEGSTRPTREPLRRGDVAGPRADGPAHRQAGHQWQHVTLKPAPEDGRVGPQRRPEAHLEARDLRREQRS